MRTRSSSRACSTNSACVIEVFLATKGGHVRTDGGGWATDSSREHLLSAVDDSLRRFGVSRSHCGSTTVPIPTSTTTR